MGLPFFVSERMIREICFVLPVLLFFLGCYYSLAAFSGAAQVKLIEAGLKHFPVHLQDEIPRNIVQEQLLWSPRGLGEKSFVLCSLTENKYAKDLFQAIRTKMNSKTIPFSMDLLFFFNCPVEDVFLQPSVRSGIIFLVFPTSGTNYFCLHSTENSRTTHPTLDLLALFENSGRRRNVLGADTFCKSSFYLSPSFLNELEKIPHQNYLDEGIPSFPHTLTIFIAVGEVNSFMSGGVSVIVDIIRSVSGMSKNFHRTAMPFITTSSGGVVHFLSYYYPFCSFILSIVFSGIGIYTERKTRYIISMKWKIFWMGVSATPILSPYPAQLILLFLGSALFCNATRNAIWLVVALSNAFFLALFHPSSPWETFQLSLGISLQLVCAAPLIFRFRSIRICGGIFCMLFCLWSTINTFEYCKQRLFMFTDNPMLLFMSQITSIVSIIDFFFPQR